MGGREGLESGGEGEGHTRDMVVGGGDECVFLGYVHNLVTMHRVGMCSYVVCVPHKYVVCEYSVCTKITLH